ncbi:hypothetical protein Poli38472_003379 [Pythium oligandrum]|uniref:PPPDE domain-containing protein n=1 Tax=Pythium oligandrum TaxID=41045 RepID=A0A8K1C6P6_PYTOL|nr:hypothetical protein Poli38472_003379 [Pythium oligandrum]|eukprot:TMW57454.1 hypothetical protein Poli38472_003379 [Pythium oligandrum]
MAPRAVQTPVRLNVYDLSDANGYISYIGLGLFHTGVEIGGDEFSFASGAGVFYSTPRQAPGARFRESIEMGDFQGSYSDAKNLAYSLRHEFDGASYNLFTKNCNSYSEALCQLLVGKSIPAYINRAAYLGSFFSCLLPSDAGSQAPVGDTTGSGAAALASRRSDTAYMPFAGSGVSLSDNTASSSSNTESTVADRREKVRMAALRRFQEKSTEEETTRNTI